MFQVEGPGNPRPLLLALGSLALLTGGLFLLFPRESLRVMLSLAGVLGLVLGVILLVSAARMIQDGTPAFLIALIPGICALVFGVVAFANPGLIVAFIAVILGFACIIAGLGAAGAGIFQEGPALRRLGTLAAGFLLAAIGLLVLLDPRGGTVLALQLAGLLIAAAGVILLALGIRARYTRNPLENPEYRVIEEK
ncbi:MAG: DUF308 domain-containing protein [Methanomicrobiales archaeon]|nr:DUF308 domain-containing protein [Methanomicrobiales archaeon]